MTTFNVGDEVIYEKTPGIGTEFNNGTEGIILGIPDPDSDNFIKVKVTNTNGKRFKVGSIVHLHSKNLQHNYMKYDPTQQEDTSDDI